MEAEDAEIVAQRSQSEAALLTERLRVLLPDNYRDRLEEVQPVPMRSAGLVYRDGLVAWDEIWGSFCDLAMAGGPPHRGHLLEPASQEEVQAAPQRYTEVAQEICRGLHLVTGLYADPSPAVGWVQLYCPSAVMVDWLARAITMENVTTHRKGLQLSLPAGPAFRLEKEIKNVITAVAKTTHYWTDHTAEDRKEAMARLFTVLNAEGGLMQPLRLPAGYAKPESVATLCRAIGEALGREVVPSRSAAWAGVGCLDVKEAIATMRLLAVSNVLACREERMVFVPVQQEADGGASALVPRLVTAVRVAAQSTSGAT